MRSVYGTATLRGGQAEELRRPEAVPDLVVQREGQQRLLEQLQRQVAFAAGAAANPESAAVCLNVGSDADRVIPVAVNLNLPAEQTKPQVENLSVHPFGCRHRHSFLRHSGAEGSVAALRPPLMEQECPAASDTLTVAQILRQRSCFSYRSTGGSQPPFTARFDPGIGLSGVIPDTGQPPSRYVAAAEGGRASQ